MPDRPMRRLLFDCTSNGTTLPPCILTCRGLSAALGEALFTSSLICFGSGVLSFLVVLGKDGAIRQGILAERGFGPYPTALAGGGGVVADPQRLLTLTLAPEDTKPRQPCWWWVCHCAWVCGT